jgi:hypothetical protein
MAVPVVGTIPFMIFGADVTHPTSFNEADPSIAAVCASYDRTLGRFMSRVLRQVGAGPTVCGMEQWPSLTGGCAEDVQQMLIDSNPRSYTGLNPVPKTTTTPTFACLFRVTARMWFARMWLAA